MSLEARKGSQIPWDWSLKMVTSCHVDAENQTRSSRTAASALNQLAHYPAQNILFFPDM